MEISWLGYNLEKLRQNLNLFEKLKWNKDV